MIPLRDMTEPFPVHRAQIQAWTRRSRRTVFRWLASMEPIGTDHAGRELYDLTMILELELDMTQRKRGLPARRVS